MTTPANPDDLTAWLRATLDADERVAREAIAENDGEADWQIKQPDPDEPSWRTPRLLWLNVMDSCDPESMPPAMAQHIARHDPTRVLRRVAADRRILDLHAIEVKVVDAPAFNPVTGERISDEYDVTCAVCGWVSSDPASACGTLRLMALPYADRPGYRSEWAPA